MISIAVVFTACLVLSQSLTMAIHISIQTCCCMNHRLYETGINHRLYEIGINHRLYETAGMNHRLYKTGMNHRLYKTGMNHGGVKLNIVGNGRCHEGPLGFPRTAMNNLNSRGRCVNLPLKQFEALWRRFHYPLNCFILSFCAH